MGSGPTHLEGVVLAPWVRCGSVAVRRGEEATRGVGDVRFAEGAGERVGYGER